jgi:hypothetical protein
MSDCGETMNSAEMPWETPDVLVVGAGNAALCSAISAHENGARVQMLEAAPFEERGGNSHFTGGAFRFAFRGVDDLIAVLPSLAQEDLANVDFGTYSEAQFFDDLFALTQYRSDPDLAEILVRGSLDTAKWVARQGVRLQPGLGRQAYEVDGKFKFWGGLALHIWGGGPELLKALYANVERRGIPILYEAPALSLIRENGRLTGVTRDHRRDLHLRRPEDIDQGRGRGPLWPAHTGPLCGGRNGRRPVLPQLRQRHRSDVGRHLRPAGGTQRGAVRAGAGRAGRGAGVRRGWICVREDRALMRQRDKRRFPRFCATGKRRRHWPHTCEPTWRDVADHQGGRNEGSAPAPRKCRIGNVVRKRPQTKGGHSGAAAGGTRNPEAPGHSRLGSGFARMRAPE